MGHFRFRSMDRRGQVCEGTVSAANVFPVVYLAGVEVDQLRLGQPVDRIALVDDDGERVNRNHRVLERDFFVIVKLARDHADLAFAGDGIL